jgi:hypothetical protein
MGEKILAGLGRTARGLVRRYREKTTGAERQIARFDHALSERMEKCGLSAAVATISRRCTVARMPRCW